MVRIEEGEDREYVGSIRSKRLRIRTIFCCGVGYVMEVLEGHDGKVYD